MPRAWYGASKERFMDATSESIVGALTVNGARDGFDAAIDQVDAWGEEVRILKRELAKLPSVELDVFFEFNIPRMGRRIDVLLLIHSDKPHIVILEFKVGSARYHAADIDQVTDYGLEMKNFHEASHGADIFPVLVITANDQDLPLLARAGLNSDGLPDGFSFEMADDGLARTSCISSRQIGNLVNKISYSTGVVDAAKWENAPYRPTPTIVEAARALYANHDVRDITRSEGSAINIKETSETLIDIISKAKAENRKVIAFVTGVPGAGKTLVGLNIATVKRDASESTHAVFLSGNGPLVAVLQEALARDEVARNGGSKSAAKTRVKSFIQNVHHFRDEGIRDPGPPTEHVAIFDEAQRAWTADMTIDFMRRKKGVSDFNMSEPQFLISCLDRHDDWAVVVCLVGGGQEINRGEAGISEWLNAVLENYPHWDIAISDRLSDSEYDAGRALFRATSRHCGAGNGATMQLPSLHLAVSMRSFRAENVSNFVKAMLDLDREKAIAELAVLSEKYPIRVTRNLAKAKAWIRSQARGTERPGLLASSKALRLKPFAIDVKGGVDPVHYFLDGKEDPRSSYFLEVAGSEFDVQGLELDYALVSWDADFRMLKKGAWSYHDFRGHRWMNVNSEQNRMYLKNAYRVLLTRARQGMVIFVPHGNNPPDPTRDASYYDETYRYLLSLGIKEIASDVEDRGY